MVDINIINKLNKSIELINAAKKYTNKQELEYYTPNNNKNNNIDYGDMDIDTYAEQRYQAYENEQNEMQEYYDNWYDDNIKLLNNSKDIKDITLKESLKRAKAQLKADVKMNKDIIKTFVNSYIYTKSLKN